MTLYWEDWSTLLVKSYLLLVFRKGLPACALSSPAVKGL